MNKKGITILELLISMTIISIVILLLLKVMTSLTKINNDPSYASSDEISRTTIIKNIETDFLKLKLNGLNITSTKNKTILNFSYEDNSNLNLEINKNKIVYNNEGYTLESKNATYEICPNIEYLDIDEDYYLIIITIPVLIDGKNDNQNDDLVLTYLGLKKDTNNYNLNNKCLNN